MPITPAYTWKETEEEVTVEVALRNTTRSQVDIVSTECFLKINSSPYLLQIDLYSGVDAKRSTAEVNQSRVVFTLHKAVKGLWDRLTAVGEKQEILERRQRSLEAYREAAGKQKEDARLLKERTNKLALEKQWALEEAKRQTLEKRKGEELKNAQDDLLQWQTNTAKTGSESEKPFDDGQRLSGQDKDGVRSNGRTDAASDSSDAESEDADALSNEEDRYIPANKGRAAIEELDDSDEETDRGLQNRASEQTEKRPQVEISKKQRIPTLVKEAANQESEDGPIPTVVKQAANPGFGNLLTAESEEANDESPLIARSSRRLQPPASGKEASMQEPDVRKPGSGGDKENQQQLETSKPAVSGGDESQKGGKVAEAVPAAVLPPPRRRMVVPVQFTAKELRPNVPARESRLQEIELKKAQAAAADEDAVDISERQPAFLKDKGDALYRAGDFQGAIAAYSRALDKDPSTALCFSNRGACQLRLGRVDDCVSDCTRAVDLLRQKLEECEDESDGQDGAAGGSDGLGRMGGEINGQDQAGKNSDDREAPGSTGSVDRTDALEKSDGKKSDGSTSQGSGVEQNQEHVREDGSETRAVNKEEGSGNSPDTCPSQQPVHSSSATGENGTSGNPGVSPESESAEPERNNQNGNNRETAERPKRPSDRERIRTALIKALVRRAAAQCEKALFTEAIADYGSALKLDPGNRGIEKDLEAVRDCVNPPPQSEWKARGDARYREGEIEGAAEAYTRAVDCEEQDAAVTRACISNRSACYLQLERFAEAEADCSRALALLGYSPVSDVTPSTEVPTANLADSQACLKLLSRRGMVFGHQKKYDDAMQDLAAAAGIAAQIGRLETVEDLNRDIELLRELQARQHDVK